MPIQEIMKLRTIADEEMRLSLLLAIHCAPILLGIKAANMVMVTESEYYLITDMLQGTDISFCFFRTNAERGMLYLYREQEMLHYLHSCEILSFLKGYGYKNGNLQEMLEHLSKRIWCYNNAGTAFPHEIGIFLEYPLMDVKGFLEHNGAHYIFAGYWKVYADAENAFWKFKEYDLARDLVLHKLISGKKLREMIE